jgi:hypothetical protein
MWLNICCSSLPYYVTRGCVTCSDALRLRGRREIQGVGLGLPITLSLTGGVIIPRDLAQMLLLGGVLAPRFLVLRRDPMSVIGHLETRGRDNVGSGKKENTSEFGHFGSPKDMWLRSP